MTRRLKVDMSLLEEAFENSDPETTYYLDLDTGEVVIATGDTSAAMEELAELAEEKGIDLEEAVAASSLPDWMQEDVVLAARIEAKFGVGAIVIPKDESRDAFRDMADFAETVASSGLRRRLEDALDRPRPFRRFKDAIASDADVEARWYAFEQAKLRERIRDWLAEEDIELIED